MRDKRTYTYHLRIQLFKENKLLRQIAIEGQSQGLFRDDLSVNDITKSYALFERGMMYDWCISSGNYSLCQYSEKMLPLFIAGLTK